MALGWLVASRPERTVGAVLSDPLLQSLATAACVLLLLAAVRERILVRLDAWLFPEATDQRQAVARAAAALAGAGETAAVSRTLSRTTRRGCGSPATLLAAADTGSAARDFVAPDGRMAPLARASAIVHMLETAGGSLRVHPDDKASLFPLLPPDDAEWVVETGADAVVRVPGPGAELFGVLVGRGGMGAVYLARDLQLERDVAVKTLTGMSVARLMALKPEAWAMATVSHPAVAQIHGVESWRGRLCLIVEYLARGTLADRLRRGPLPPAQAVSVAEVLADALGALHETGYLHGDVKPSNVGLTSNGSPKLLDFGLARAANGDAARGGTLRYLSPEALAGHAAEEADDVWSLCVVLYEMASGEHPFAGGDADEVASRIRRQRLGRPASLPAGAASRSAAVIAFAASVLTAPRPARPATALAFADALRGVLPAAGPPAAPRESA